MSEHKKFQNLVAETRAERARRASENGKKDDLAITPDEADLFDALTHGSGPFALARTMFDGEKTTCIVAVTPGDEDSDENDESAWHVTPLYVQVTEKMFGRLADPTEME